MAGTNLKSTTQKKQVDSGKLNEQYQPLSCRRGKTAGCRKLEIEIVKLKNKVSNQSNLKA
jgi:hypothetical protein